MNMMKAIESSPHFTPLSAEEQAILAEQYGADTLYYCKDAWALRRYWQNKRTGETQRARCNRWACAYCGPRKVNLWRELVRQAEPVLFLTLTKAGKTVEEARRALTTFMQALRRGSKGKGPNHKGAREAYPVEYFGVLERHKDFERNGFHWHLLLKGVESIPYKEVIQPLWMSATHYRPATEEEAGQGAMIAHIERIRNNRAIGYVTKYLMKALSIGERGKKEVKREKEVLVVGDNGAHLVETQVVTELVTSKAHRVCYSRQFFPERVAELRQRLFAGLDHDMIGKEDESKPVEESEEGQGSDWMLVERDVEGYIDMQEYQRERYAELAEELEEMREADPEAYAEKKQVVVARIAREARLAVHQVYKQLNRKILMEALSEGKQISRRVINMWDYHRKQVRLAG
jgi:hypothetical protein